MHHPPPRTHLVSPRARPWLGGLGYGSVAPFFGELGGLDLGRGYSAPDGALLLGGGGGAVLFHHLWIGGKGYGLVSGGYDDDEVEVSPSGGGGGLELGFVFAPNRNWLVIPYAGLGGFGYDLEIKNGTNSSLIVDGRDLFAAAPGIDAVSPGETRTYRAGFWTVDAGIRVQRLLFWGHTGMTVGAELGFLSAFTAARFKHETLELQLPATARLHGVLVRLNLGGGGFVFR